MLLLLSLLAVTTFGYSCRRMHLAEGCPFPCSKRHDRNECCCQSWEKKMKCDLQEKKVCTGKRKELLDDTAGESGWMNPWRCEDICRRNNEEGCCMYEVDHKRCFIIRSGGSLKTDNSVKREIKSIGYHAAANGGDYEDVPQRHAGWCKMKLGGAEEAVGFSNKAAPWWTWFGHGERLRKVTPRRPNSMWDGLDVHPGGTRAVQHVGTCTVAQCVEEGFHPFECEAEDGQDCLPFTTKAPKCSWRTEAKGCEKFVDEWAGDGTCDLERCGNCHDYWVDGVFDKGDCEGSDMEEAVAGYAAYQEAFAAISAEEALGVPEGEEAVGCMSKCTEGGNSYNDCKDYCGADLQAFAREAPTTRYAVLKYGFAAVGVSVLMFGAFRHYTSKSDRVDLELA